MDVWLKGGNLECQDGKKTDFTNDSVIADNSTGKLIALR